jgi:hypothetical protein
MNHLDRTNAEATAVQRMAEAARQVQAASAELEKHFQNRENLERPTLLMARFAAAMSELHAARESFDSLLRGIPRETK